MNAMKLLSRHNFEIRITPCCIIFVLSFVCFLFLYHFITAEDPFLCEEYQNCFNLRTIVTQLLGHNFEN